MPFPGRIALACLLCALPLAPVSDARAGVRTLIAGGVSGEDYAQSVFQRMGEVWTPPHGLQGDFLTRVLLRIDRSGRLTDCQVRQSSGLEAFDASACGAAYKIGRFTPPPDGQPVEIMCSIQIRREAKPAPDPDEELKKRVREQSMRALESRTREAGYAEEDARARAEAVARERGETFSGYDFAPGQAIPGAPELLQRRARVSSADQQAGAGQGTATEAPVRGPVISRYPPAPEKEQDLVVVPVHREEGDGAPVGRGPLAETPVAPRDQARTQETIPAKTGAEPASAPSPASPSPRAGEQAGGQDDHVVPQPPLPPAGVQGRDIESGVQPADKAAPAGTSAAPRGQARPQESLPAKTGAEPSSAPSPRAGKQAGGQDDYVVPQPPLPPAGVRGRVILPSVQPAGKARPAGTSAVPRSQARIQEKEPAKAGAASSAGPSSASPSSRTGEQAGGQESRAMPQPPLPASGVQVRDIEPGVQPADKAASASASATPRSQARPQESLPAKTGAASSSGPSSASPSPRAGEQAGGQDDYVVPQPPLPPAGVRGRVILPSVQPAGKARPAGTSAVPRSQARTQEKKPAPAGPSSSTPSSRTGGQTGEQASGPASRAVPQPPLPASGVQGRDIESGVQPADKAVPAGTSAAPRSQARAQEKLPAQTGAASSSGPSSPSPRTGEQAGGQDDYVVPQPPLPPAGVRGRVILPSVQSAGKAKSAKTSAVPHSQTRTQEKKPAPAGAASSSGPSPSSSPSRTGGQTGGQDSYVVPQPPLPPAGVRGRVIDPNAKGN